MVVKNKRRGVPFSDLRARLEEYAGMKNQEKDWFDPKEMEGKRNLFTYYPFSALWLMHRFLLLKLALVFLVITIVFALTFIKMPVAATILQSINHLATWETDFGNVSREVLPALQRLWTGSIEEGLEKPVLAPAQPGDTETSSFPFTMPLEGELIRNFGPFEDARGNLNMSYGLLLSTPGEAFVYASAEGIVKEISRDPGRGFYLVLEHHGDMETHYNYLKEVVVEEREIVSQGQLIGQTGFKEEKDGVVLYFEIRDRGRPIDPIPKLFSD